MLLPSLADLGSAGLWWDFQSKCHREGFVLRRPGGPLSACSPECSWMAVPGCAEGDGGGDGAVPLADVTNRSQHASTESRPGFGFSI